MTGEQAEWDKYAVLCYLVKRLEATNRLGKKAVQKYIYLLQDLKKLSLGYNFKFYTYGPFSSTLAADVDLAAHFDAIAIAYDEFENAYSIHSAGKTDHFIEKGKKFLATHQQKIDEIIANFGGKYAKDLELIATLVFVVRNSSIRPMSREALISETHSLKPKFGSSRIGETIDELVAKKYFKRL